MHHFKYRPDIDGLRAVAVLSVLIFHIDPKLLPGGFIGVDIFFVISGYLISIILWNAFSSPTFSFPAFYVRRAHRLLPALYATVGCTLVTAACLFPASSVHDLAVSAASALASASNVRFALQSGYFDSSALTKPLLHTWSLAVEEQFYLVWPLLLKLVHTHRHRLSRMHALTALFCTTVLSEICTRTYPTYAYFLAPFRFHQFLVGAALHLVPPPPVSFVTTETMSAFGVAGIMYALFQFDGNTAFPGVNALLPSLATALLILSPSAIVAQALACAPVTMLGRISYSVYLVHWSLIVSAHVVSARTLIAEERFFLFVLSLVLGYALHHTVEKRFRAGKPSEEEPTAWHAARTLALFAAAAVALAAFGFWAAAMARFNAARVTASVVRAADPSRPHTILPGANATEMLAWTRRLTHKDFRIRGWMPKPVPPSGVPGYGGRHLHYAPPAPRTPLARMLMIGDSHAGSMRLAFIRLAMEHDIELNLHMWTACPALFGTRRVIKAKGAMEACAAEQAKWQEMVKKDAYDFVVVASRWQWYFEPGEYGEMKVGEEVLLDADGRVPPTMEGRKRVFENAFRSTVATIADTGAHVIVLSQMPHVGKEMRGCMQLGTARKAVAEGRQPKACLGVTRKRAMIRSRWVDQLIERVANEDSRVTAAIPCKYFCDNWEDKYCRSVYAGGELYKDSNHVSPYGSMFFMQRWKANAFNGLDWAYRNDPNYAADRLRASRNATRTAVVQTSRPQARGGTLTGRIPGLRTSDPNRTVASSRQTGDTGKMDSPPPRRPAAAQARKPPSALVLMRRAMNRERLRQKIKQIQR